MLFFSLKDESTLMKTGKASEEHEEIHTESDGTDSLRSTQTTSDQEHVSARLYEWKKIPKKSCTDVNYFQKMNMGQYSLTLWLVEL